jgi:hypothetical protein
MDDVKRRTLNLMELATFQLNLKDAGHHLILIAADWATAGELLRARNALSMVSEFYYEYYLVQQAQESKEIAEAIASLVEAFGVVDFQVLRVRGFEA